MRPFPTVPTAGAPDSRFATTLAHGLAVLEAFADGAPGLSNKQLSERTGLSKATISRLTTALASRGLITFDPAARLHRLGSTTLVLGYPLLARLDVRRIARLPMKRLADGLEASVSLGMRDRARMVYVETSRGNDPLAFRPDVGAALPMLQSAMGRAWLCACDEAERRTVLREVRVGAPAAYRKWSNSLVSARADLQQHGFCISRGDWQQDVHAVAVPLRGRFDGERLVLNCGVAARRLRGNELGTRIGPQLVRLARQIESEAGART